jgi:hypothetical protein
MSEELEVLKIVTRRLNEAEIPYMISSSIAANYYTVPRMTRDVDIVVEMEQGDIDKFVGLFEKDFYLNRETVTNEVSCRGMFNLIHNRYVVKIDFIINKSSAYQQTAFSRRKQVLIEQSPMWFVSAEDLHEVELQIDIQRGNTMNDTHPDVAIRFRDLMMSKTGQQRLLMGCSMYDTAKKIVRSAIYNNRPEITDEEMKKEIFLRFYGQEFSRADRELFLSALTAE